MRIDRKLNLVMEIEGEKTDFFVHSMPISRAVFEKYYLVLGKAFSMLLSEGMQTGLVAGPRMAALVLKDAAMSMEQWEGQDGVEAGLMGEIRRLTNVVMPAAEGGGWETIPYTTALARKMLNEDDAAEVEGSIVFFICVSAMVQRRKAPIWLDRLKPWGGSITSQNVTEYSASLPTSIATETSESTLTPTSSVPS